MDEDNSKSPEILRPTRPQEGSATFGPALSVHVRADNLNIHSSNLSALERIADKNPEIASQIIRASENVVRVDGRKYQTAAISSVVVALAIIGGSATIIATKGVVAGIIFFAACVAASAIITTLLTGKAQDISWTVRMFGGLTRQDNSPTPPRSDD